MSAPVRYITLKVICTGRHQHPPTDVLGLLNLWPDGVVEVRNFTDDEGDTFRDGFTTATEAGERGNDPLSDEAVARQLLATAEGTHRPHIVDTWRCRKCGIASRIDRDKLTEAARALADAGYRKLDISLTE